MEELLAHEMMTTRGPSEYDDACANILVVFYEAHHMGFIATGSSDHVRAFVGLEERRIPLLGKSQRFRDQGEAMCRLSDILFWLRFLGRKCEAATWYQRARDVGAAHGFFSLESKACVGLGRAAMEEGRYEEGLALLRNALVAAELNELDDPKFEVDALMELVGALFTTTSIEEVEPLVLRYREAAKALSGTEGVCSAELNSLVCSARLHEVLCLSTQRWNPLLTAASVLKVRPNLIFHRVIRAR